jgi:hypothetical protein
MMPVPNDHVHDDRCKNISVAAIRVLRMQEKISAATVLFGHPGEVPNDVLKTWEEELLECAMLFRTAIQIGEQQHTNKTKGV